MKKKFQWGPFLKQLTAIAIPVALQNLLTNTGSMIDEIMIAPLGEQTVGAVGLCAQFTILVFGAYWGIIAGGTLFISQYWGAQDEKGVCRSYGLMWLLVISISAVFCILSTVFPEEVMMVYTDKPVIREIGVRYLRIIGYTFPLNITCVSAAALLRATGHVQIPLVSSVISVVTNVFFNWALINGNLGFPQMGIEGAALATVISSSVNLACIIIFSLFKRFPYLFRFRDHFRFGNGFAGTFIKRCIPLICNELLVAISGTIVSIVFGHQSEAAIAAFAVISVLEGIYISFFCGFSASSAILTGNAVGGGQLEKALDSAPRLLLLCTAMIAAIDIPILIFGRPLLSVLGLSGESLEIGWGCLIVFAVIMVFRMGNWLMNDTFRAGGETVFGTVVELSFIYVIDLVALVIGANVFHLPFVILFILRYLDDPLRYGIMLWYYKSGRWIKPVTKEGQAALPAFYEAHKIPKKHQMKLTGTEEIKGNGNL